MPRVPDPFVAGLVLAAGGSRRLGRPKQLLPYGKATLLDHTVATARSCGFGQLLVALGGRAADVRAVVDLDGADVVINDAYGSGCSSSIAASLTRVDSRADVLVLLLGDQPGVTPDTVASLLAGRSSSALAVCAYDDGPGHPFAFGRELFGELGGLHGDKAVWRLLDERSDTVAHVAVPGDIPLDVDTWEDYEAVLAAAGLGAPAPAALEPR